VKAKEHKVPLLMFTSLGDNILVDIERYDISAHQEIFNGAIGGLVDDIIRQREFSVEDIKRYSAQIVGSENLPTRALESLLKIGTKLIGRPQLYSTVAVDGGLAAFLVRSILLGSDVKAGRYFIRFADLLRFNSQEFNNSVARKDMLNRLMGPRNESAA
jgi:hypothetical protein